MISYDARKPTLLSGAPRLTRTRDIDVQGVVKLSRQFKGSLLLINESCARRVFYFSKIKSVPEME